MTFRRFISTFSSIILTLLCQNAVWGAQPALKSAAPVTLRQCYEWAKGRSENLKIRMEDIEQSDEQARSALSGALPHFDWKLNDTYQDPQGVSKLDSAGFSGFVEKNQIESKFTVEQPLFSGLREFSAYAGFKRERARNVLLLERAVQQLFENTADTFYTVLSYESDWENTHSALVLAEDRVKQLIGFRKLGKSRKTEVYTAKARALSMRARLDQIQAGINSAREDLSYLSGKDLSTAPLVDEIPSPPVFEPLAAALEAGAQRSDIRAQREELAAKERRIRYEKGFYWPTADLSGNYYTRRATFLRDINWDVTLSVDMPLYQGGRVSANVREAMSSYRQAQLMLEEMERDIYHSIRKIHNELSMSILEAKSSEEAARAAQQSYDALLGEYKLGLVTNLDVLEALDLLQSQKSARDAARLKAKRLFIELNVAMEREP